MNTVRVAMTQTLNAFRDMPDSLDGIASLADRLDDIRSANVRHNLDLLMRAGSSGIQAVCLGELFTAPYFALTRDDLWFSLAEDAATGPTISEISEAAARLGIVVVAPIYECEMETGRRFNTAVVIDADGTVLGKYRKVHIPVGGNEQACFDERYYYEPSRVPQNEPSPSILGDNPYFPVFKTAVGNIGVSICYDRHFEGVTRSLHHAGAQIIFSPAVTFGAKSKRMWEIEFEVDAARHGLYLGGSNRLGAEKPWNQPYFGRSSFFGPDGRVANISEDPCLAIAECDLDVLEKPDDSGWDLSRDARPSVYS